MTDDPAFDWDCFDAETRERRRRHAGQHLCKECDSFRPSPEGKYGWCTQWEDFADGELSMTECDFWND